jgi:hypothetical protein
VIARYGKVARRRYESEMTVEESMSRLLRAYEVAMRRLRERRSMAVPPGDGGI